jgi:hypothetical protein
MYKLPKIVEGKLLFASNTNIVIKGNNTWIVLGSKARVFYSADGNNTESV